MATIYFLSIHPLKIGKCIKSAKGNFMLFCVTCNLSCQGKKLLNEKFILLEFIALPYLLITKSSSCPTD